MAFFCSSTAAAALAGASSAWYLEADAALFLGSLAEMHEREDAEHHSDYRGDRRASWLPAMMYARFCDSLRWSSTMTGTSVSPSLRAASNPP